MRLLIHGMQSSGASALAMWLAQRPDSVAIVDVPFSHVTPFVDSDRPIVAKCVITTAYSIEEHKERFQADCTVLLVRDPYETYYRLVRKGFRNLNGFIDEKLSLLEGAFRDPAAYDAVVHYEDLTDHRPIVVDQMMKLGWPIEAAYDDFPRGPDDLLRSLLEAAPKLFRDADFAGLGDVKTDCLRPFPTCPEDPDMRAHVREIAPRLSAFYRSREVALTG